MKKLPILLFLLMSGSVQAYKLTFYNDTKENMKVEVQYTMCKKDTALIESGKSYPFDAKLCCLKYFKVEESSARKQRSYRMKISSPADYHVSMCKSKDFHIVYANSAKDKIRVDW